MPMNPMAPALAVANTVLYEGYILFPYTASAKKNRIRWQFGVLVPRAYEAIGTGEPSQAQTEIVLECSDQTQIDVLVRFLQVETRWVQALSESAFETVDSLEIDGCRYVTFDEGIEREVPLRLSMSAGSAAAPIAFSAEERVEPLHDAAGTLRGRIVRRRWPLHGSVTAECEALPPHTSHRKIRIRIENESGIVAGERSSALRTAFVSTHTLLHADAGRFLSLLDPPSEIAGESAALSNRHTWPVLIGDGATDAQRSPLVLSSPIILYDFPSVAEQTEGDTFDATEIDELMMLSVRSLSDAEREEARATDPRARAIVERAERFGPDELTNLHGMLDIPAMDCVFVNGTKIAKGSVVRLRPKRRADVWDAFLEGKLATVRAVHQDVDNQMYVAVTVDDDPASDLHNWYGRSLFFYPDEVEPEPLVSERLP
jgi:hypothetical protein